MDSSLHFLPEHQVYTYNDGESPGGPTPRPNPSTQDAVSLLSESPRGPDRSGAQVFTGNAEPSAGAPDGQEKLSRCLSDPGPNNKEGGEPSPS